MRTLKTALLTGLLLAASPAFAMNITSADVASGAAIAQDYAFKDCKGKNISPALSWSGVPKDAKTLAITVYDTDVPGGFWHWIVYDIPVTATGLPHGAGTEKGKTLPAGAAQGTNSFSLAEYSGPCPPEGAVHHYQFTLWALDSASVDPIYTTTAIRFSTYLHKHAIDKAVLAGTYGR